MTTSAQVRSAYRDLQTTELLRSPVDILIGISPAVVESLKGIRVVTIYDLATSPVFEGARRIVSPSEAEAQLRAADLVPRHLLDAGSDALAASGSSDDLGSLSLEKLNGVGPKTATELARNLGVNTIGDLAAWPPYSAALAIAGMDVPYPSRLGDPEIPDELVPRLNEHATDKSFYSVYTLDPSPGGRFEELSEEIDLGASVSRTPPQRPRTGSILRYEQSWTPIAVSLGNLLHSLALAPGESTRIALADWSRRQGVRTTEDVSQLESLANSMLQNRSINEVTRAIAREAQTGFSNMNANSTVSNSAYTSYGLQNSGEVLDATVNGALMGAGAGAAAGGTAGAGIGGVAGAIIGGVALAETVVGIPGGIAVGAGIGAVGGGAIGAGTGSIVGGTAGGAAGFLGSGQFGSSVDSGSSTTLDVVTTTSTSGTRDVEGEMLQNISDRTHQHSSSARNRRAAIVQEVSQSETEQVSTRVVTNYNHMHALTVQYFEVIQQYVVRTTLVSRQRCLYVPIRPIERWTIELINTYRNEILSVALTPDVAYSLLGTPATVTVNSPSYPQIPREKLRTADRTLIRKARQVIDSFVSNDPLNGWRLPDSMVLNWVWGVMETGGGGPFGGLGGANNSELTHQLVLVMRSGERLEISVGELEDKRISLAEILRIEYVVSPASRANRDLAAELPEPVYGTMQLHCWSGEDSSDQGPDYVVDFTAHYMYSAENVIDGVLTIPIVEISHAPSMAALIAHLNANSAHYSSRILRGRRNPLLRRILSSYSWEGEALLDVVDQEPIAVSGNSLVFLLHKPHKEGREADGRGTPAVGSVRSEEIIPIGTGGVFAEAVQGRANAAERLDLGRFWDWQDSPIPIVAPEIAPVALGSRAMAADVRPGGLDPSLLQQMAARGLPDPQGIAASLGAVSQQMFRDMSGLAEAARVAQTSLQEAMSGATASGDAASENLRAGMEQTHGVMEQVIDMNEKFATLLAEQGFGLLTDAARGALGSTLGGSAGAFSAGGGAPGRTSSVMAGATGGVSRARAGSTLAERNASIAGAVLNRAAARGGATAAPPQATGGALATPPPTAVSGAGPSPTTGSSGAPGQDLEGRILGEMGGLPPAGGATAGTGLTTGGAMPAVPGSADSETLSRLMPLLARASESDDAFFAAVGATLDLAAERVAAGHGDSDVRWTALTKLVPAWNAAINRVVTDFNGGDGSAINRIDQLLAVQQQWTAIAGTTTIHDVISRLDTAITIGEITAPEYIDGGESITVGARVMQRMPGGSTRPAEGAPVSLRAWPSVEEFLSGVADADGRVSFSFRHGLPDPDFEGLHLFSGWLDLDLFFSASASFSSLINGSASHLVPGKIAIELEEAYFLDDGSNALIGSVVNAPVGRTVLLNFRATKGGQALQGHPVKSLELNGEGAAHATDTDTTGAFTVQYLASGGAGSVAYLSPVIETSEIDTATAMASISIL